MVVWVKNAPKFEHSDLESHRQVVEFIDRFITTSSDDPTAGEFVKYQQHKCTHTCRRKNRGKNYCRFGAPFFPMKVTKILSPFSEAEGVVLTKEKLEVMKDLLMRLQDLLNGDLTFIESFDEMLAVLGCSEDEYIEAIRSQLKSSKILLKREPKDCRVNAFSPKILSLMRSNMDIQFVLDPYACIGYIVDYINKSNRGLSLMLRTWLDEFKKGDGGIRKQLQGLANVFYNGTETSAQEAAWCRLRLPMSCSSEAAEFINTSEINKRQRMLKSAHELQQLPPDSTDIMKSGHIERYADRHDDLEDICLAEFVACYNFKGPGGSSTEEDAQEGHTAEEIIEADENDEMEETPETQKETKQWKLKTLKGTIQKRRAPRVIRFVRYDINKDSSNYFREHIMLYVPWREELKEVQDQPHEQLCKQHADLITENSGKFTALNINFNDQLRQIEENRLQEESEELADASSPEFEPALDYDENVIRPNLLVDIGQQVSPSDSVKSFTVPDMKNDADYFALLDSLNVKQRDYLMHIVNEFKTKNLPIHHFITGKAGVGKSRLISAIYQSVLRIFRSEPGPVETNEVVLVAYTGKAAHNIGGMTAHSAFSLVVTQNQQEVKGLAADTLNTLRVKLRNMKLLIIDEISMLGSNVLFSIHHRLCQIFGSKEAFGGRSVIVLGDFKQLRPVGDSYAFKPRRDAVAQMIGNPLWSKFKLFELTEIMRQKDDLTFAEALGRLSEGKLTADDVNMFIGRTFKDHESLPPEAKAAIHLFKTNDEVDAYNTKRVLELTKAGDTKIPFNAVDKVVGNFSKTDSDQALFALKGLGTKDTQGLPTFIQLQTGVRYMVTTNIDVADGLFNGATGIMRFIEISHSGPQAVWIEFDDASVGTVARSARKSIADMLRLPANYTPVERVKKVFQVTKKGQAQVSREQYPLVIAEGITIHKSQGQSMSTVVVQLSARMERTLLYVALSRATSVSGLFLIGNFKPPSPAKPTDEVVVEMNRLKRDCELIPKFVELREVPHNTLQIISHNVQSISKHIDSIKSDQVFINSHIMLFQETWATVNDVIAFGSHQEINRNDLTGQKTARGTMIFAKTDAGLITKTEQKTEFRDDKKHIEITTCSCEGVKILNIYIGPQTTFDFLKHVLIEVADFFVGQDVLICGDFNPSPLDFSSEDRISNIELFLKNRFQMQLMSPRLPTTNKGTTIDAVFGKLQFKNISVKVYESNYSYHKPLLIRLTPK